MAIVFSVKPAQSEKYFFITVYCLLDNKALGVVDCETVINEFVYRSL